MRLTPRWSILVVLYTRYKATLCSVETGAHSSSCDPHLGCRSLMCVLRMSLLSMRSASKQPLHCIENIRTGIETRYMEVSWGLGHVRHELTPAIDCANTATVLDIPQYYDNDRPIHYPRILRLFELSSEMPVRPSNTNFTGSFSSSAELNGPKLVLQTTSTV